MNIAEFTIQVDRLKDTFGDKAYSSERVKLLWDGVKYHPLDLFHRVVDQLILSHRQPPMISDIRECLAIERERCSPESKITETDWDQAAHCDLCSDSGVFLCVQESTRCESAFRCQCRAGETKVSKSVPQYKQGHKDNGFKLSRSGFNK